jgi:hypothetical protein
VDWVHVLNGWMYGVDGLKIFKNELFFFECKILIVLLQNPLGQDPDSPESL